MNLFMGSFGVGKRLTVLPPARLAGLWLGGLLVFFCLLLVPVSPPVATATTAVTSGDGRESPEEAIARRLQQTYDKIGGFSANFHQLTLLPMSRRQREGGGTVIFRKPHQMRWEYTSPDHQVLAGDGHQVRLFFAASRQMFIRSVEDYLDSDLTYAFFAGTGNILRDFKVQAIPSPGGMRAPAGEYNIRLIPRAPHPQVDHINLGIAENPFFIRRLEIVDHFGSATILTFSNIELDPAFPPNFYRFEPPPGTEILVH